MPGIPVNICTMYVIYVQIKIFFSVIKGEGVESCGLILHFLLCTYVSLDLPNSVKVPVVLCLPGKYYLPSLNPYHLPLLLTVVCWTEKAKICQWRVVKGAFQVTVLKPKRWNREESCCLFSFLKSTLLVFSMCWLLLLPVFQLQTLFVFSKKTHSG